MGGKGIASTLFAMPLLSCFVLKGPPVPEISQVGAEGVVPPPPPPPPPKCAQCLFAGETGRQGWLLGNCFDRGKFIKYI